MHMIVTQRKCLAGAEDFKASGRRTDGEEHDETDKGGNSCALRRWRCRSRKHRVESRHRGCACFPFRWTVDGRGSARA